MKHTQKGFIAPLLIAIIAVLAIGGGAYVFKQSKLKQVERTAINSRPVITSISPSSASVSVVANNNGINATIIGTGFLPRGNAVLFGNSSASVRGGFVIDDLSSSDGKTIQFQVPMDALFGVSSVKV